jgi:hypothetical protein
MTHLLGKWTVLVAGWLKRFIDRQEINVAIAGG